jgi:hypothetical protein
MPCDDILASSENDGDDDDGESALIAQLVTAVIATYPTTYATVERCTASGS